MFEFFLLLLAIYLAFLVVRRRLFPNKKPRLDIDQYLASDGVARFLDDCVTSGFSRTFAQDFARALVAGSGYPAGIEAPSFQQNLFQHWGIGDDLHEIVNQLLPSELAKLPWNDPALRKLQTIFDLMTFIQSESRRPASNPDHPAPSLPRRHPMGIFQDLFKRVFR